MIKKISLFLFFSFSIIFLSKAEFVNMKEAGAVSGGKILNTSLINNTIKRLSKDGGGTLFFPAGKYLTGAIHLESNITIDLESGCELVFSDNFDDYLPFTEVRHEGVMMKSFSPLFYASDAKNITITGRGCINGQGQKWWKEFYRVIVDMQKHGKRDINKYQLLWEKANDYDAIAAVTNKDWRNTLDRRFFRPPFIQFIRSKNILIENITIKNSPFWTVNPEFCDNVTIKGITINNPPSPNTDGINPESCKNVRISDCHISVGDDCITIKSGRDKQARELNAPCENITITNCTMLSGHGGVVIGSEMSGGVNRVVISNCVFDGTDRGIRIKSTRGRGGVVENIRVSNIVMRNIKMEAVVLNLKYSKMPEEPVSSRTPVFRNISINAMTVDKVSGSPIKIVGLEEFPVSNISLNDIRIYGAKRKCVFENCKNIDLRNVYINNKKIGIK